MRKLFLKNNFSKIWGIHPSQQAGLNTNLISVDSNDNKIGEINKINAHLNEYNYSEKASPHRAFSLFIFDKEYNLLVQQRSNHKITFRNQWANSCCSHQLPILDEIGKYENSIQIGKNRAEFELNLDVEHTQFQLISKILYKAKADETWGEYELDYLYFLQLKEIKPKINPNLEEVREINWISLDQLRNFKEQQDKLGFQFTPWFDLICKHKLNNWWELYRQGKLNSYKENNKIENLIQSFSRLHSLSALKNNNYYEILQVNQNAQEDQIKLAYVKQSAKYHSQSPQHNQIKFDEIQEAFRVLANSKLREEYDKTHFNVVKQKVQMDDNAQLEIKMTNGQLNYTLKLNKQQLEHLSNTNDAQQITYEFMKDFIQNQGGFQEHLKQINYDDLSKQEVRRKIISIIYTLFQIFIKKK